MTNLTDLLTLSILAYDPIEVLNILDVDCEPAPLSFSVNESVVIDVIPKKLITNTLIKFFLNETKTLCLLTMVA